MLLLEVERPDALLQGQEALVDLCALRPRLLIIIFRVRTSLAASKVNEAHPRITVVWLGIPSQLHLQDSV